MAAAVNAAEYAAFHARYQLYGSALTFLADMASELRDEKLLRTCRSKETELAQMTGLAPDRPAT
ncbi:hypothetical protein [Streptomyces caeruleatus]|uniref:Uncharacterized protein n=1 Tax=Streptomyces caeruleatus TaxID=661399 RepID=A0A101U6F3_9ACTN|nr:hypothetical protein [Streptomyces caeruleatus]KUO04831.1 hypothetical protein AQJ67_10030 [Streptomyces caeruleatus]